MSRQSKNVESDFNNNRRAVEKKKAITLKKNKKNKKKLKLCSKLHVT